MILQALKSKTILLGLAVALIPFLQALQSLPLTATQASLLSGILGVLVMINRAFTTVPLSEK